MTFFTHLAHPLKITQPAVFIATGFGSGLLRPAPGTWGSVLAWGMALGIAVHLGMLGIAAFFALCCGLGWWAVGRVQAATASHDDSFIVIDEWAGVTLALLFVNPVWDEIVLALLLFRFFDILKPWPIGWLDKNVQGPSGVMLDDIVAGLCAGVCVYGYGLWMM